MHLAVLACAVGLLALFPDFAYACPVCFDRDDEARIAFLATTGLLTLLPLGMVGGFVVWIRKRGRVGEAEGAEHTPESSTGHARVLGVGDRSAR